MILLLQYIAKVSLTAMQDFVWAILDQPRSAIVGPTLVSILIWFKIRANEKSTAVEN